MSGSVRALKRWLVLVALLRLLSVVIGIFRPQEFKTQLFDLQPDLVTPMLGRLFAAWTSVTCVLCLVCARDPTNRLIYTATLASFLIALAFFIPEVLVYHTVSPRKAISPMVVASVSTLWMGMGFNYYTRDVKKVAAKLN